MAPFSYPAAFTAGNAGRNIVTGLPLVWSTVAAKKNFKFKERYNVQVRVDYNNFLKTFNFDNPTTTVTRGIRRPLAKLATTSARPVGAACPSSI